MLEKDLQAAVIDLARWHGYLTFHVRDSRKSTGPGFPDLVLLHQRTGNLLVVELKSETGKLTDGQFAWLDAFRAGGHYAHVWRPKHWTDGTIRQVLEQGTHPAQVTA